MLTPEQSVVAAILLCLAGAVLTLLVSRQRTAAGWLAFAITAGSAALILPAVWQVLTRGPAHPAQFFTLPALGFALRIYVDGLTSVFLLLAVLVAVPASLYSIRYLKHYADYGVARYHPYFLLFLAAMFGLLSTTDMMWFFFIFWQMMTLPGYALIRFEHRNPANVRAANKFLVMMQIACAATMIGAELLAVTGAAATGSATLEIRFRHRERQPPRPARGPARHDGDRLRSVPRRLRHQDGHVAVRANLAARRASGRAVARERDAFRRDDQDGGLWPDPLLPLARARECPSRITRSRTGVAWSRSWARSRCSPARCRRSSRSNPSGCSPSTASARSATSCSAPARAWRSCRSPTRREGCARSRLWA